jgi:hypothetical protein
MTIQSMMKLVIARTAITATSTANNRQPRNFLSGPDDSFMICMIAEACGFAKSDGREPAFP